MFRNVYIYLVYYTSGVCYTASDAAAIATTNAIAINICFAIDAPPIAVLLKLLLPL